MNKLSRFLCVLGIISGFCSTQKLSAQLNNTAFEENFYFNSEQDNKLYFKLRSFNFLKNNEFFNDITSGRTLFGTLNIPSLVYYPDPKVRLEAGGFLWKDFGDDEFTRIAPVFRLTYKKDCTSVTFGNLLGNLNHQLIEPLYDFDHVITQHLEAGLQFKHHSPRFYVDLWVDWQNRIFRNDDEPEIIFGGLVTNFKLIKKPGFELIFPLQTTFRHEGGQDLTINIPVENSINIATGLNFLWKFSEESFLKSLRNEHYYVSFLENNSEDSIVSREGMAYYGNLNLETRWFDLLFSLWLGNDFDSVEGGELYRSFSVKNPGFVETNRNLLFIRILKDIQLIKDLSMTFRFEPYYDFNNQLFEYSFGVYMHFQPSILLKKFE